MEHLDFDWDSNKSRINLEKHGVDFNAAQFAFGDAKRVIALDVKHCTEQEQRYFCYGRVGDNVLTVRFTWRKDKIRIIGAGYWRQGRRRYDEKNGIH
jgi:uncharacterized protein